MRYRACLNYTNGVWVGSQVYKTIRGPLETNREMRKSFSEIDTDQVNEFAYKPNTSRHDSGESSNWTRRTSLLLMVDESHPLFNTGMFSDAELDINRPWSTYRHDDTTNFFRSIIKIRANAILSNK